VAFGFDPLKVADLVRAIRAQLAGLAVLEAIGGNGHGPGPGRLVLTVRADSEAVAWALEQHLTAEEMRRIRWVVRG